MTGVGLACVLALLGVLLVRVTRQVYAPTAERRPRPLATFAELALWVGSAVFLLPRVVELLT